MSAPAPSGLEAFSLGATLRVEALRSAGLLAERRVEGWDRLGRVAAHLAQTMVLLCLASEDDLVVMSACSPAGNPVRVDPTPLSRSLDRHVVGSGLPLVISDARLDSRLPAVDRQAPFGVVGYAGFPIRLPGGPVVGCLSAVSDRPWTWPEPVLDRLKDLVAAAEVELDLRRRTAVDATARHRGERVPQEVIRTQVEAVRRLEELDRAKSEFIANTSHELRTPVTSILGYTSMLTAGAFGPLSPRQAEALDRVERNSHRLRRLVDDLLTLSNVEAGRFDILAEATDLQDLGARAFRAVQGALEGRDLRLELALPEGADIKVWADPAALERVLVNLLDNAVKYTADGGTVTLAAHVEEEAVVIEVADTGIGIAEEDQAELFTRFYRASAHRDLAIEGTGLGLAICKALVDAHNGSIRVRSAVRQGTKVQVTLPHGG